MVLISLSPSPFLPKDAMTNNQIRESEETVLQVIHANDLVFAKESPLSLAKEIQGLRAVFDEVPHTHTLASFPCHIQMGSGNEATPCAHEYYMHAGEMWCPSLPPKESSSSPHAKVTVAGN